MITTYKSEKSNIVDALNEIDEFTTRMNNFMEKHPNYGYKINIRKNSNMRSNNIWVIELIVDKDES